MAKTRLKCELFALKAWVFQYSTGQKLNSRLKHFEKPIQPSTYEFEFDIQCFKLDLWHPANRTLLINTRGAELVI